MAAGQGFKTFATGDVLTAADTNGYLMQGIWVFADATARDAAVTSPQEGNACYLKDTDNIMVYSGSAWVVKSTATSDIPSTFNPVVNSCFDIAQRGTSVAVGTAFTYTLDRWQGYRTALVAGMTVSRQATGDTTNLPNVQFAARVQRDSGNTGTGAIVFYQSFESINSIPYAGKVLTFSFYARKGANYSQTSSTLTANVYTGTGTDQNLGSAGFTGSSIPITKTATLTTTWQRFSASGTISSTATQIGIQFDFTPVGTAGAADYFEVTGVQLDYGTAALPVRRNAQTIQGELAACQRYYFRQGGLQTYQQMGFGFASTTSAVYINVPLPVEMRVIPTAVEYSTLRLSDTQTTGAVASLNLISNQSSTTRPTVNATYTASGATQYRPYLLETNNSTSGYLAFSAEL